MKLKKTALTLALSMGLVASASAVDYTIGTVLPNSLPIIGGHVVTTSGSFTDTIGFYVGAPLVSSGTITNGVLSSIYNITDFNVDLYSGTAAAPTSFIVDLDDFAESTALTKFGIGTFPMGDYFFKITGKTTGQLGGSYTYVVLTTAVPEPESYALFLAGLGIMGAIARRRSKANAV